MRIAVSAPQSRQPVAPYGAPRADLVGDKSAERRLRRLAGEPGEADDWGRARTPEAEALLLSRAVALGLDWLLYER